jgi:endonuclease YncB( thermonuclease family)
MKKIIMFGILLVCFNSFGAVIKGMVTKVIDGDTIKIQESVDSALDKSNPKNFSIRFAYIDAPESKQNYGKVVQKNVKKILLDKQVVVYYEKIGIYGRILGVIFLKKNIKEKIDIKQSINYLIAKNGLAWVYGKKQNKEFVYIVNLAKQKKKGLWGQKIIENPSDFRKRMKKKKKNKKRRKK